VIALLILAAGGQPPPAKPVEIPYRLTDTKHVLVRAKLNGKGPYNFILDTGAPAVFIPKKLAKTLGVDTDDKGWGEFDSFEVEGGLTVPATKTRVEDLFQLEGMNGMGLAGVELHGVIGYNVLAKFRITYDFTADKLLWVPLDFDPPPPKGLGRESGGQGGLEILGPVMKVLAGFMGIKPAFDAKPRGFLGLNAEFVDDKVVVASLVADGPAAKAGLKVGDHLTAVSVPIGRRPASFRDLDRLRDLERALSGATAGTELKFKLTRGGDPLTVPVVLGKGL
jgi:hypothetical protein